PVLPILRRKPTCAVATCGISWSTCGGLAVAGHQDSLLESSFRRLAASLKRCFTRTCSAFAALLYAPMLPGTVRFAFWCSTSRTVEPADVPAANGRSLAALFGPFRHGGAAWSLLEGIL